MLRPLLRDTRPAVSLGFSALWDPPSLCHRFCFLGHFQLHQYFIPLDELLGEKQGLDMALKEREVETSGKKPKSEHSLSLPWQLNSTVTILIPWERKRPGVPDCRKPAWTQTIQALSHCTTPNTDGSPESTSEHCIALHFKGLSTEKSRAPYPLQF